MHPIAATVARLAAQQHGRITCEQLPAAGVDRDRIKRWVADGRLRREHRGVYALGHPSREPKAVYMSAVLASGSDVALSHRPVGYLRRVFRGTAPRPEVTTSAASGRKRPGIRIHRSALHPLDVETFEGIRVTTLPRMLLDLAPRLSPEQLSRACHEAWIRHGTRPQMVEACIARNPRKPGAEKLIRAMLADVTLSVLEDAFVALLRTYRLPPARTNIDVRGDKVDCHWPQTGLTIELVSYRFHASRQAFEADVARRRRSNHLAYSYGDIVERPAQTAQELAAHLNAYGSTFLPPA
jgi:hypothetical protein